MEPEAGKPLLDAEDGACRSVAGRDDRDRARPGHVPEIEPPQDTKYIRHIRMRSDLLSEFWGRDMYVGAHVLVPEGFDEHPEARYPLMVFHGHFPRDFGGVPHRAAGSRPRVRVQRALQPRVLQPESCSRKSTTCISSWISPDFPRFLAIEIQHPTPYYDDSYAVNSASQGPWGDALTYELIPYIEAEQFRGLGEGWSPVHVRRIHRRLGGPGSAGVLPRRVQRRVRGLSRTRSTSGRTSWSNIYEDENAYFDIGPFGGIERPAHRDWLGNVSYTVRNENHVELVRGTKGRSGGQWDIWEATYSPMGDDGYPQPHLGQTDGRDRLAKSPSTGEENFDLRYMSWSATGPRSGSSLEGQDPHLRRRHGQLLPQQRRVPDGGISREHERSVLRRASWTTETDSSIAGTGTTRTRTPSRGCDTTRCICPASWSGLGKPRRPGADLTSWRY